MSSLRVRSLAMFCFLATAAGAWALPHQQLVRVVNDSDTVPVPGNVHPRALASRDAGPTDPNLVYEKMVLVLSPRADAVERPDQLIARQHDPSSADYHRWITPEEYGQRFGISDADLTQVTSWLERQGFTVDPVPASRGWINFSGKVSDVERAFRTTIRNYRDDDGTLRHANALDPQVPRALADIVHGVVSLHNFPRKPMNRGFEAVPAYTTTSGSHYVAPADFAKIYNVNPLYTAGVTGSGQSIAIVGRTDIALSDVQYFRSYFGLPSNDPQFIHNGTDPGDLGGGEEGEADLDVQWSGAVARNATIKFVISKSTSTTDGVDLSAQYIVNNNVAKVMSTSFGQCESQMGTSENQFYSNLWSQAAAQGITSFVSSGDSGAAGCNGGGDATGSGKAVSGLASTPYNVAVGGTQFSDASSSSYWASTTNSTDKSSALGYIPEAAWNESADVVGGSGLWASSGGQSIVYAKPSWQTGVGVPSTNARFVPDVALTAAGHDGYLVIQGHTSTVAGLMAVGGTSASSPSFAGIMALVDQKTGQSWGNANTKFYALANAQYSGSGAAIFHDITVGNNSVPGVSGFSCATGYDAITGLGSVDANALVNNFGGTVAPSFAVSASPLSVSVVQGGTGSSTITTTVAGGFNSAVSLSATGAPVGATITLSKTSIAAPGSGSATLTFNVASTTATGSYTITVTASGGGSTHTATVTLAVTAAPTPNFALTASPASKSIVRGTSGTVAISSTVSGGFNSAVSLTATGAPAGTTVSFSPASFAAPGSGSSTMTIVVGSTTVTGSYTITINGTGGGKTHTATVALTVAAAASPDFALTASPTTKSIVRGTNGTVAISSTVSGGFNSAVALTATGAPAGVTLSLSPTSFVAPGSGTSTLTFAVTSTTTVGTYTITVTGSGGGKTHTATMSLTVSATTNPAQLIGNPGFENGSASPSPWSTTAGVIDNTSGELAHSGTWKAWLDGYGTSHTDAALQTVTIPATATTATLSFWLHIDTAETTTSIAYDTLRVQVRNTSGAVLATLATYSNLNRNTGYAQHSFSLAAYRGQTVQIYVIGAEDSGLQTSFVLDDFALNVQ